MVSNFKNFMKRILSMVFAVVLLAACSNESLMTGNENTTTTTIINVNYNLCKMTAETEMLRVSQYDDKWNGAEITDHYYWYNPMVEDAPAYIEFKVTKDGKDAGYVMVSTTEQDFEVPEYSTEGKTMYECLQAQSGTQDITATRFNSFDYMAEVTTGRGESKRVFFGDIAYMNNSEGGRGGSEYDEYIAQYKAFREKIGGIGGSKVELSKHYEMKKEEQDAISRGDVKPLYSDMHTYVERQDLLPTYKQFSYKGGASGCGPTAAAILLAYWHRFHGKTNFFYKTPSLTNAGMTDNEKDVIKEIGGSAYMKTSYHDGVGSTDRLNLWSGLYKYIANHGYNHGVFIYYWVDHNSDEASSFYVNTFAEWNIIFKEIQKDKPAILRYQESSGHYAVIYDVVIERNGTTGFVNDVKCSIITGWGDGTGTIPARKTINAGSYIFNEVTTCNIW